MYLDAPQLGRWAPPGTIYPCDTALAGRCPWQRCMSLRGTCVPAANDPGRSNVVHAVSTVACFEQARTLVVGTDWKGTLSGHQLALAGSRPNLMSHTPLSLIDAVADTARGMTLGFAVSV